MSESKISVNSNSKIFNGTIFLVTLTGGVFSAYNSSGFSSVLKAAKASEDGTAGGFTVSGATFMLVCNIIFTIILLLICVWSLYRLIFDMTQRKIIKEKTQEYMRDVLQGSRSPLTSNMFS